MKIRKMFTALCLTACLSLGTFSPSIAAGLPGTDAGTVGQSENRTVDNRMQDDPALTESLSGESKPQTGISPSDTEGVTESVTRDPETETNESAFDRPDNPQSDAQTDSTPETSTQPSLKDTESTEEDTDPNTDPIVSEGWNQDGKGTYYIKDGKRLTGWQTLEQIRYYFDKNGYRAVGLTNIDGKVYFFDNLGFMKTGSITYSGKQYYFDKNGVMLTGFLMADGKKYYYNPDGSRYLGSNSAKEIGGKWYFISSSGEIKTNGWNTNPVNKNKYYSNSDGTLITKTVKKIGSSYYAFNISLLTNGVKTVNGKRYLVKANGMICTNSINTYKGRKYYSDKYGRIRTGLVKYNKKLYYTDKYGRFRTGRFKDSGNSYYARSNGQLYTGWTKYKRNTYFYNTKTGAVTKGWAKFKSGKYYFTSSGARKTGWLLLNKKYYYFNSKGVMQTKWEKVNNKWYYLNPSNGVMKTGWVKVDGKYYYLDKKNGDMKTGWLKLGGKTYYLEASGARKTGWLTYNMKRYYFGKNGVMYTGTRTVDGKTYYFGNTGGINIVTKLENLSIRVNRAANCITIYSGSTPVKAMICSTGAEVGWTPLGNFRLLDKLRWHELDGPSWGQYCSHITPEILFHSAPVQRRNDPNSLPWATYMQLGQAASHGCIRLTVIDAKWMYDNIPVGTPVTIYDDANNPGPLGKPSLVPMPEGTTHDPTDPLF